jgi:hypothetical protein
MAKPNYAFEKRQKELAKKQKKQEKLEQRKSGGSHESEAETEAETLHREPGLDDASASAQEAKTD